MWLYHCTANGPFGSFGDYVWARNRYEAELKFQNEHHVWPTHVRIERRAK